jgi:predicted alpha/beta-hydrolase family hydrolase
MSTPSPMSSEEVTVSVTTYDVAPTFTGAKPGRVRVMHLGLVAAPIVYVSFNGTDDAMILRPGTESASQTTGGISYRKVWLRIASGSEDVCISHELATADIR